MRRHGVSASVDLVQFATNHMHPLQKAGKGYLAFCPFHNDVKNPSLYITKEMAYCFSCGKAYPPGILVSRVKGVSVDDVIQHAERKNEKGREARRRVVSLPSVHAVDLAASMLQKNDMALRYLVDKRGIDSVTLARHKVGLAVPPFGRYSIARITFPAFDVSGELKTISYRMCPGFDYSADKSENLRYLTHSSTCLLPFNLEATRLGNNIVYAGGQIDCLTLLSHGILSVGSMGEGIFKKEWAEYFAAAKVFILLDNDSAGYRGAFKMKELLPNSRVVFWPEDAPVKCDINSAVNDKNFGIERIIGMLYDVGFSK